jgi:sugar phosphate isomerase/epimerase
MSATLLHPRLSLNGIVTPAWSFAQDLAFWRECGLSCVGLLHPKVMAHGPDRVAAALKSEGLTVSTIICGVFTLEQPECWPAERARLDAMIDLAAEVGGTVYGPPGRGWFDQWDANCAAYAEAVAPCLAHARERDVTLAFEPTLRPALSFVHTLRDGLDLCAVSGVAMVVDIGNCCTERDHRATIRAMPINRMGLVQISDLDAGTPAAPGMGIRVLPGEGDLPLEDHIRAAHEAGYAGAYEIELLGQAEPDRTAIRRSLELVSAMLDRVVGR